jgi:competence protein ComEC
VNSRIFYGITLGFLLGVFIRSYVYFGLAINLLIIVFGIVLAVFGFLDREKRLKFIFAGVFVFSCGLGVVRFGMTEVDLNNDPLFPYTGKKVSLKVIIADEPDNRETSSRLTTEVREINGKVVNSPSKVLLVVQSYPKQNYGDILEISGVLTRPLNFADELGREFDYVAYLENKSIRFQMFRPETVTVSEGNGNSVINFLFNTKNFFLNKIENLFPEPESSLLGGLLLGAKQSLGKELQDDFRKAGIVHIVVLSGYNITIIAESFMKFLAFLPRTAGLSFGAISIILFALMTGASATIIRASVMALIVILGKFLGRTYNIGRALLIAGVFMTIHNPRVLVFDVSFQLSFIATIALVYGSPLCEKYFLWVTEKYNLRSIVTSTIATQIFVLPYILRVMGDISLVALPVNLLVLPFIPTTMLVGFLSIVSSLVLPILSIPFSYLTHLFLSWELFVVDLFSSFSFASVSIQSVPIILVLVVYAIFIYVLFRFWKKEQVEKSA